MASSGHGQIKGGVAFGNSGRIYFSGLASGDEGYVKALNSSHQVLWTWAQVTDELPIYNVPALSADGSRLYIGAADGVFYCLDAATGAKLWQYAVPTGADRRIRSSAAVDWAGPLGPTVYFHSFNGRLYALNATTGALRWSTFTGNSQPPTHVDHPEPVSSSPVVGADGAVYVGSRNGNVYRIDPLSGGIVWASPLCTEAVEATVALSADGSRVYAVNRETGTNQGGRAYALNAANGLPVWISPVKEGQPGILASPVVDQRGFVYAAPFHDRVWRFEPEQGTLLHEWYISDVFGKMCQTPSITQDGILIVGTSTDSSGSQDKRAIRAFDLNQPDSEDPQGNQSAPLWSVESVAGQVVGDFLGSPAIRCSATGVTYIGDTTGRLYRFNAGSPMMAGEWPTFQCGSRRTGKALSFAYVIAELPNFYNGTATPTAMHVNRHGHAVGQAHGYYAYPYGSQFGYCAAQWKNLTLAGYGGTYGIADSFANAINLHGDAAGYSYYGPLVWAAGAGSGQSLPLPGGYYGSGAQATAIADDRTIVGYGANGSGTQVLRWDYDSVDWSSVQPLSSGGNQAQAYGVSESGRIAGRAKFTPGGPWRAFKTDEDPTFISQSYELGTFGGTESWAWDIHEASGAVGWAHNAQGRRRAFYVPIAGTTLQELPRLAGTVGTTYQSEAYGVTHLGEVVGTIQNDAGAYRAFYYTPGASAVVDLSLTPLATGGTPASQGWTLTAANAIGEGGAIVGQGVRNGVPKAWILYPQCQE